MTSAQPPALVTYFAELDDPRETGKCDHKLLDLVVIAISAVICHADDWVSVEEFGRAKEAWLRTFLELPHGIPSHDTFGRVRPGSDLDNLLTFQEIHPEKPRSHRLRWPFPPRNGHLNQPGPPDTGRGNFHILFVKRASAC